MQKMSKSKRQFMIASVVINLYQNKLQEKEKNEAVEIPLSEVEAIINRPLLEWKEKHPNGREDATIELATQKEIEKSIFSYDFANVTVTPRCRLLESARSHEGILSIKFSNNYFALLKASDKILDKAEAEEQKRIEKELAEATKSNTKK